MHDILSGRPSHILFLKATTKKKVWIPQFTKKNGQVVGGHYAFVHVTDDHSHEKVAIGNGSYSQKKAHAKLAKEEGDAFHALPVDDKAALVMYHATQIQDEESMTARLAVLKKKMLAGEKPLGSEWKAYAAAPDEKQQKMLDAMMAAGKLAAFDAAHAAWTAANPGVLAELAQQAHEAEQIKKQPQEHAKLSAAAEPASAPKAAPASATQTAEPEPAAVDAAPEPEVKLPPGAPKKPNIMGSIKAKEVANKIEASMLAGDHDALDAAMADVPMTSDKLKWQKIKDYANDASKFIHDQDLAPGASAPAAESKQAHHVASMTTLTDISIGITAAVADGDVDRLQKLQVSLGQLGASLAPDLHEKTKKLSAMIQAGLEHLDEKEREQRGGDPDGDDPEEGDTKPGKNGSTLVLKDGHWVMQASSSSAWAFIKDAESGAAVVKEAAKEWQAANPGKDAELSSALVDAGYLEYAKNMGIYTPPGAAAEPTAEKPKAPRIKSATVNDAATTTAKAKQALVNALHDAKVVMSNTNAKSFNPKVDAIIAALEAGDEKALLGMSFGTNTYGKKAAKLANQALEHMGSAHTVDAGQKAGAHDGLKVKVARIKPAEPAQSPADQAATPVEPVGGKLDLPGKMGENFELVNIAYTLKDLGALDYVAHVKDWVSEEDIAAFDALTPVDQSAYVKAVMAWHPDAKENMAQWLAWKDMQPQPGVAVDATGMPQMPTDLKSGSMSLVTEAKAKYDAGALDDLEEFADYAEASGLFQSKAVDYVQKLHAHLAQKQTGKPSEQIGAGPNPLALHESELPEMPIAPTAVMQNALDLAKKSALMGHLAGVKSVKEMIPGPTAMPATHVYLNALISKMEAKGAAPSTGTLGLLDAEIPHASSFADKDKVAYANQLAKEGDAVGLQQLAQDALDHDKVANLNHMNKLLEKVKAKQAQAGAEAGPKDGDTKQGADGMLIFQDGRWHKMGEDGKAAKKPTATDPNVLKKLAASVPMPKLSGSNAIKMTKCMKAIKALAESQGAEGVAKCVVINSSGHVKINSGNGNQYGWFPFNLANPSVHSENGIKMATYAKALMDAMDGTTGAAPAPAAAEAAPAAKPAAKKVAMPTPAVSGLKTEKVGDLHALVADGWKQVGPQGGSNPGGLFEDGKGGKWYCKFPNDPETVKNELLAAKFYQMLGVDVPNLRLVKKDGKLGIASGWVDGVKKGSAEDLAKAPGAHKGFVFDAWLANWDVVGLGNDNLMLNPAGKAVRIDVGGSLIFRAQGGKKGAAFGNEVPELSTLRDAAKNEKSAAVFADVSEEEIKAGVRQLNKLKPSQIEELVQKAGPGTDDEKKALAATLIARREFILRRYKVRDQWNKKPVDETKVKINPGDIQAPIDFHHHPDKGGGPLSSKEWLNKQNTADSAALAEFAKQGNLKALKDYHYQAVDGSGNPAGMKSITQHPSNHIQKQWASLVQTLQSAAYPPAETLEMPSLGFGGTLEEMAKEVGSFAPSENVTTVPAEHRLGYFMSLAKLDGDTVQGYVKEKKWNFIKDEAPFVQAGKDNYAKNSKLVKQYIGGVQGNGTINHIWSQGKTESGLGVSSMALTKAIYDEAIDVPEGTQLWRWMDDDTAADIMTKQLKEASPGTVLQNTDSMCTSFKEAWGATDMPHFCGEPKKAILMRIRCADGAKITPSYGSGAHWNERELTTLPGSRFVIVSVTPGDHRHPDGIVVDCIMLPPDEGFIAQLAEPSPLTKSETWSEPECLTNKINSARLKVIVLRRVPSPSRATTTLAVRPL